MKTILTALLLAAFLNPFCPCLGEVEAGGEPLIFDHCGHPESPGHGDHGEDGDQSCAHSDVTMVSGAVSAAIPKWIANTALFDVSATPPVRSAELRDAIDPSPPPPIGRGLFSPALTGVFRL